MSGKIIYTAHRGKVRCVCRNMLDLCEALVTLMYVVAALAVMFGIHVRCRATVEDVERHCLKQGKQNWYTFKVASVVVLVGGAMHARRLILLLIDHAIKRASG